MPILEIYPTIYAWYDYNTNPNLATDSSSTVSNLMLILSLSKLALHLVNLTLIFQRSRKNSQTKRFRKIYKEFLEYEIIPLFTDASLSFIGTDI